MDEGRDHFSLQDMYDAALLVRRAAMRGKTPFLHTNIGHALFTYDEGEVYISAPNLGDRVSARELAASLGVAYPDDDAAVDGGDAPE